MKLVVRGGLRVFLLAAGLFGCGESPPGERAASDSDGLVNGFELHPFAESSGVVFIEPVEGTGILLTNEWVLTVAHNIGSDVTNAYVDPSQLKVTLGGFVPGTQTPVGLGQVKLASQVIVHPFAGVSTLTSTDTSPVDLALIRVSSPFIINGSTTGHRFQTYKGTGASLLGRDCLVFGAGPVTPGGQTGAVRYGAMEVRSVALPDPNDVRVGMDFITNAGDNGNGQPIHTAKGDSGAPC